MEHIYLTKGKQLVAVIILVVICMVCGKEAGEHETAMVEYLGDDVQYNNSISRTGDENLQYDLFHNDYIWRGQIYGQAVELAEEHGLYQFLDIGEPWLSKEGHYCAFYIAEYSDSGVYLEAQSKDNYKLIYRDSVYTENFAGMDYRMIDFDRQKLAELEDIILRNGVNERCRLYVMEDEEALISTDSGTWYSIDMTHKTMMQTDSREEGKAEEEKWDFQGEWGEAYREVLGNWTELVEYEKEFADTLGGTVQYDPHLIHHIGKDLVYERYALKDLDRDGTPELILLSNYDNSMNAVFCYTDRLVYCGTYYNALYTGDGKIMERGSWWSGSVMITDEWTITEIQGGKVIGQENLWGEYQDSEMKNAVYMRSINGETMGISYEEYCDRINEVLSRADFVRNISSKNME